MQRRDWVDALLPLFAVLLVALVVGPLLRRVAEPMAQVEPPTVLLVP